MKIAIISSGNLPVPAVRGGAVETGIQQLVEQNEVFKDSDLTVYSIYDSLAAKESMDYKNTNFIYLKNNKYYSLFMRTINKLFKHLNIKYKFNPKLPYIKKVCKKIKKENYDKILIKNAVQFVLPVSKVSNHIYLQIHNDFLNSNVLNARKIYKVCDKVLVNSHYIKERVLTIPTSKDQDILVNMNCTDVEIFNKMTPDPIRTSLKNKYSITSDDLVIMYSGRLIKEKGIRELILAMKQLPKNYKLIIVGSKWFGKNIKNSFIKELHSLSESIKSQIIFTGYIPYKDIPQIHSISDIAVVPSIWEEPAGRVVIEAESSGLPVIVSDAGGISDYISNESSVVVKRGKNFPNDLATAIVQLGNDKVLREKMGLAGKTYASQFNPKRYYTELIEYLNKH